jgi:hypothetical protein
MAFLAARKGHKRRQVKNGQLQQRRNEYRENVAVIKGLI